MDRGGSMRLRTVQNFKLRGNTKEMGGGAQMTL